VNSLCRLYRGRYNLLVMTDRDVFVCKAISYARSGSVRRKRCGPVTSSIAARVGGTLAGGFGYVGDVHGLRAGSRWWRAGLEGKVQFAFGWTMATTNNGGEASAGSLHHHLDDFELEIASPARGFALH